MSDLKRRVNRVKAGIVAFNERLTLAYLKIQELQNENEVLRRELLQLKAWQSEVKGAYRPRDSRRKSLSLRGARDDGKLESLLYEEVRVVAKQSPPQRQLEQLRGFAFADPYIRSFVKLVTKMMQSEFRLHEIRFNQENRLSVEYYAIGAENVHKQISIPVQQASDLTLIRNWCKANYIKTE